MSIKGHPYPRFRRALVTGSAHSAFTAALELPQLQLPDALALTLVLARDGHPRYERAAARWCARLVEAAPAAGVREVEAAAVALQAIAAPARQVDGLVQLEALLRVLKQPRALAELDAFDAAR